MVPGNSKIPTWTEISYHSYCRSLESSSGLIKGVLVTPEMPDWTFLSQGAPSYVPPWSNHVSVSSDKSYWNITRFFSGPLLGKQLGGEMRQTKDSAKV